MAVTLVTAKVGHNVYETNRYEKHAWDFDGADGTGDWGHWPGGQLSLGVPSAATYGGGTLTWYAKVNIKGVEHIHEIAGSSSTAITGGVSTWLNECEIRPVLAGSTNPTGFFALAF